MARSRSNPEHSGTLLLLGAAAVGAYGWYAGWFTSLMPVTTVAPAAPAQPSGTTNPVLNPNTQIVNAPSTAPPLGTIVTNANDQAAQVAANYTYIVPSAALVSQAPSGYAMVKVSNMAVAPAGVIYLRNDILQKDLATANAVINAANAATRATMQANQSANMFSPQPLLDASSFTLADLSSGVSGLGASRRYSRSGGLRRYSR